MCGRAYDTCFSFPSSLIAIGNKAFQDVDFTDMESLPSGLTTVGDDAFLDWGCEHFLGSIILLNPLYYATNRLKLCRD